jgi:hypothetical protein
MQGYGDIVPDDPLETSVVIFIGIFGALFVAAIVASITISARREATSEADLTYQKRCLFVFLESRGLGGTPVHGKVMAYFNFMETSSHTVDDELFLKNSLPPNLCDDFKFFRLHKLILDVPQFQHCSAACLRELMRLMRPQFYLAEEWIICTQCPVDRIFFLEYGRVHVFDTLSNELGPLFSERGPGNYFGDECLNFEGERLPNLNKYSVKASSESLTWFLDEYDFRVVVTESFPCGQ